MEDRAEPRVGHYDLEDVVAAIRKLGVGPGDVVFSHVGLGFLGYPREGANLDTASRVIYDAFWQVLGPTGTWVVPTYTYSYCKQEVYDPQETPSTVGPFTEFFRHQHGVTRSLDPIFSVAARGARAQELLSDLPRDCFGYNCIYDRLRRVGAKICNVGVGFRYSTFVHYVEDVLRVPYRYRKLFSGRTLYGDELRRESWIYNVRVLGLGEAGYTQLGRLEGEARARGMVATVQVGRGALTCVDADEFWNLCAESIKRDPWVLVEAQDSDLIALEEQRVGRGQFEVNLPSDATAGRMIEVLSPLSRDLISDGYDAALRALSSVVPLTIHEYATGSECWTWLIPEKWRCHEAFLETIDGRRLFSYSDHPLHVVSYSLPFEGEISREELFKHLHTHPRLQTEVPFIFKYYERDWGLCCSQEMKEGLKDERYRVVIRTDFSYGTLKVGEVIAPGESEECIVLCAHLCHPAQVNDDMAGVAIGIDTMRALLSRSKRRYTYRFLIVPETIGSVAFLSHNEHLIAKMKGGLFLEMLSLPNPHVLQQSLHGDSHLDRLWVRAARERDPLTRTEGFLALNDERQFNGPGVHVPMMALYRILPTGHPDWPYREYHSTADNLSLVSEERLEETRDFVLHLIDVLEQDEVPVNRFKGEVFLSRFGLHIDWYADPEKATARFQIMYLMDGKHSISQIAERLDLPFAVVRQTVDEFARYGLVVYQ